MSAGKLTSTVDGKDVKVFLSDFPYNNCNGTLDSTVIKYTLMCSNGDMLQHFDKKVDDTLYLTVDGSIVVFARVYWHKGYKKWTADVPVNQCIKTGDNPNCYTVVTDTIVIPDPSPIPTVPYTVNISGQNFEINTDCNGVIIAYPLNLFSNIPTLYFQQSGIHNLNLSQGYWTIVILFDCNFPNNQVDLGTIYVP